jgi:thiol:disulfide interchange protein
MDEETFEKRFEECRLPAGTRDRVYRSGSRCWTNVGRRPLDSRLSALADLYWAATPEQRRQIRDSVQEASWELVFYVRRIALLIRSQEDTGRIVVLDFTAEWCLTCKYLKATVLDRDPVRSALNNDDVVKFTVDLTSTRAPGWEFLRELGQTGIPLLAIFTPGDDEPWQANAYTSQQVLAALEEARNAQADALARR